jgi:hypothetical protein
VGGAVIAFDFLTEMPASIVKLSQHLMVTRTPYVMEFTDGDRGKMIYMAACWQNQKGQRGRWSKIVSGFVP